MKSYQLITPEGTKDHLFEEAVLRKKIKDKLQDAFRLRGYHEVVTPSLEFMDVFTAKEDVLRVEDMYKLTDSKGRLMVLRPDSTMPIARLCATRLKNEALPLRLYYNQSAFSVNQSLRGRSDEFVQTGIELVGVSNRKSDIEVLVTAAKTLEALNIDNFRIEIGHIGIFHTLIESLDITAQTSEKIRFLIQSKNYSALRDLLDTLPENEAVSILKILPRLFGGRDMFDRLETMTTDTRILSLLTYLKELYQCLCSMGLEEHVTVDLGIVNRTDYYTGIVFKGYVEGYGEEILSGGRYDSLLREFGRDAGAIGFVVNVDSAVNALFAAGQHKTPPVTVLVFSEEKYQTKALEYIDRLAGLGVSSEYSLFDTLEQSTRYAKENQIRRVDIIDENTTTIQI